MYTQKISPLFTYHLCLSRKGSGKEEKQKVNHGVRNDKHLQLTTHTYNMYTAWSSPLHILQTINLWIYSKSASTYLSPASLYHVPSLQILNYWMEPLKNILYRHCILITWKTNTYTLKQSHHYSLTSCVCPGKGASARGITKANHGVWNDKYITANYTYMLHVHCMIFPLTYTIIY